MKRLFRILHWRARARYWRKECEAQKREVARLKLSLLAERYRNLSREDAFASAAAFGARGMYGIAPRTGPALVEAGQPAPQPTIDANPFNQLSWPDKAEFETEWWPLAEQSGRSKAQAQKDFMRELANRRQLNDEPFTN